MVSGKNGNSPVYRMRSREASCTQPWRGASYEFKPLGVYVTVPGGRVYEHRGARKFGFDSKTMPINR